MIENYKKGEHRIELDSIALFQDDYIIRYQPTEDLTIQELSLIMVLSVAGQSNTSWDYIGYIKRNNLEKHFSIIENIGEEFGN